MCGSPMSSGRNPPQSARHGGDAFCPISLAALHFLRSKIVRPMEMRARFRYNKHKKLFMKRGFARRVRGRPEEGSLL